MDELEEVSRTDVLVVLATFPSEESARQIGTALVSRQLAACVNLVPGVRSIYRWDGRVQEDAEVLAVIKTTSRRFTALRDALVESHPYDVPEVLAIPVAAGFEGYLAWVRGACSISDGTPGEPRDRSLGGA